MGVLQCGPGWCYVKTASGFSVPVVMLQSLALKVDIEQKFVAGQYQMDEFSANTGLKAEGKAEFQSLDLPLLMAIGLSQYSDGTIGLLP